MTHNNKQLELIEEHSAQLERAASKKNLKRFHEQVLEIAEVLRTAFMNGNNAYVAGNGGSAAEAQHFSDEMLGRYKSGPRGPLPMMALTTDGAALTCIGNDFGFDQVFSRQLQALGKQGDIFIGISQSGESKNILEAAKQAKGSGMIVITFTGGKGGLREFADHHLDAVAESNPRVQELHLHAIHLISELLEA